jgi:PST family polysaccharide transporter
MAIVVANVVRSALRTIVFVALADRREWLTPCRIRLEQCRDLLRFGLPLSFGALAAFASRRWDNLLVARFFGAGPAGAYNLAYNLADVPAIQVGEQIGDVLFPSFARMDAERRKAALVRSLTLLGLLVFPLAVGLGAVAPALVSILFDARWQSVAPMLMILSVLSVTRPVGWTIAAYLQAEDRPRAVMMLEAFKLASLLGAVYSFGRVSPLWTCFAVGIGFAAHTFASLWVVQRLDRIPFVRLVGSVASPFAACIPLALGVAGAHYLCESTGVSNKLLELVFQICAGAVFYAIGALVIAPSASHDLLERARELLPNRLRPRNA